jgi:hypothetical protein
MQTEIAKPIPKGFTCECGEEYAFGAYVAAHAYEWLFHTCPECDREHKIFNYQVYLVEPRRKAKVKKAK